MVSEKRFEKWARTREMGPVRYILVYGVLFWGMLTAAFTILLTWALFGRNITIEQVLINLFTFALGGVIFGAWTWSSSERAFAAARKEGSDLTAS